MEITLAKAVLKARRKRGGSGITMNTLEPIPAGATEISVIENALRLTHNQWSMIHRVQPRLALFMEGTWHLPPELNLWGIYLPSLVVVCLAALLIALATVFLLERLDMLRFVWHPPLFFLAMAVFNAAILSILFLPR